MKIFSFIMVIVFILINTATLQAETTNYQWIYDKNGDCAIYDDVGFEKNLEVFWSGVCRDKKAQGYGIAIISSENNSTRSNLFRYEGNIKNGKYNGQAYLRWYKTGDKGSFNFADSVLEGEANIMTNNGKVFLNANYTNGKFTLNKKAAMSTSSEEAYDAFRKTRKPAYEYETLLRKKLIKPCEYHEHTLRARKYDGHRLSALAFRSLISCYSENQKYKEALDLYNDALKYPKADNKFFIKLLHRPLAFAYHGLGKYEKSFNHLEKLSDNAVTKETLTLLESKHFIQFDSKRKKLLKRFGNSANNKMFEAIKKIDTEALEKALRAGANINFKNQKGETPLIKQAYRSDPKAIKLLIESGADVNSQSNDGSTALMNASYNGHIEVVKLLIEKGADINLITKKGNSAVNFAVQEDRKDILTIFFQKGIDINKQNKKGETLLTKAIQYEKYELANFLLKNGADVNIRDIYGNLPLYYAIYSLKYPKNTDIVFAKDLLLKYGSNLNDVKSNVKSIELIDEKNLVFVATVENGKKYIARLDKNFRMRSFPYNENNINNYFEVKNTDNLPQTYTNSIGIEFVLIPAGKFTMGYNKEWSKETKEKSFTYLKNTFGDDRFGDGQIERNVTITTPFYISKYEITQEQWNKLMDHNPSLCAGANKPVEFISWIDADIFTNKLNDKENTKKYRLPTEAEWEYVAWGDKKDYKETKIFLNKYAQLKNNRPILGLDATLDKNYQCGYEVGQKAPNSFGVYDMIGNVSEFVSDWYNPLENYNNNSINPKGASSSSYRTFKGCSTIGKKENYDKCRPSLRKRISSGERDTRTGFRLVFTPNHSKDSYTYGSTDIAKKASRSVLRLISANEVTLKQIKNILTKQEYNFFQKKGWLLTHKKAKYFKYNSKYYQWKSHGSAYLISDQGHLVTNSHAVDTKYSKDKGKNFFLIESLEPYKLNPIKVLWRSWDDIDKKNISTNIRGKTYLRGTDLAIIKTKNQLNNIQPLMLHKDGANINYYKNLGRMVNAIGFTASYDDMHQEPSYIMTPKTTSGELDGATAYIRDDIPNMGKSSVTGSGGASGGPIINTCGEVIGTIQGGGSWGKIDDFSCVELMFEPLDHLIFQLDKLGINYKIANEQCFNHN